MRIKRSHFDQLRFVVGTFLSCASILYFSSNSFGNSLGAKSAVAPPAVNVVAETSAPIVFEVAHREPILTEAASPVEPTCTDPDSQWVTEQIAAREARRKQLLAQDFTTATDLTSKLGEVMTVVQIDPATVQCEAPQIEQTLQTLAWLSR